MPVPRLVQSWHFIRGFGRTPARRRVTCRVTCSGPRGRGSPGWITFAHRADQDFARAFSNAGVAPTPRVAVFMLSFFGAINYLEDAGDKGRVMRELFETTLDVPGG